MKPERPVIVLVFAILNLVFGGMGLVGLVCGGVALVFVFAILGSAPGRTAMLQFPSGLIIFFVLVAVYGLIMNSVLTLSGIGLLNMKPWARKTAIAYSIITIIYSIVATVINIAYVGPTMQQLMRQQASPTINDPTQSPIFNAVFSIFGGIVGMAYAIALLVVMLLSQVSSAFAGGGSRSPMDLDRPDDEFED